MSPDRNGVSTWSPATRIPRASPAGSGLVPAPPGGNVGAVASIRSWRCTTCACAVSGHSAASSARILAVAVPTSGAVHA